MGDSPNRQSVHHGSVPQDGGRSHGNSLQYSSDQLCQPLLPPSSSSYRCLERRLEQVERCLHLPPSISSQQGSDDTELLQRRDDPDFEGSPAPLHSSRDSEEPEEVDSSATCSKTKGSGSMGGGWTAQVIALDNISILQSHLEEKVGHKLAAQILKGKRKSTRYQNNVGWKAFQDFIRLMLSNPPGGFEEISLDYPSPSILLAFCLWLRESRGLESSTIANYKASVASTLNAVYDLDCNSWEFKALKNSLFLEKPPKAPRIPDWDLRKVLDLLSSDKYNSSSASKFNLLKKSIFLIALAAGNRISEIAATVRNGIGHINKESRVRLPVAPGFLFKNQRQGRNPPAIEIAPLGGGFSRTVPSKYFG